MKNLFSIILISGVLFALSACSGQRVSYEGPVINFYKDSIQKYCQIRTTYFSTAKSYNSSCGNCYVRIHALYKGPDKWRRVSFTLDNVNNSIYHNLESKLFMCGASMFVAKYPNIDRNSFERFYPTVTNIEVIDGTENVSHVVSVEDWQQ